MRNLKESIEKKYPTGFSLYSLIRDHLLNSNTNIFYVPSFDTNDSRFMIAKDTHYDKETNTTEKVQYLYFSKSGDLRTFQDDQVMQVPLKPVGFIARISINKQNYIPEALTLDYLIDISNLKYTIHDTYYRSGNDIISAETIGIESIELKDYPNINFHPYIKEFFKYKKEIFDYYFN